MLLLILYVLDRLFVMAWLSPEAAWLAVAVVWLLAFLPGIVGTFGSHRLPAGEKTPRPRWLSLTLIGVSLVVLAAVGVITFLSVAPQYQQHTIDLAVTTNGAAHVSYSSKGSGEGELEVSGDWSHSLTVEGSQTDLFLEVTSSDATRADARVSCRISSDGKLLDEHETFGAGAMVSCHAES